MNSPILEYLMSYGIDPAYIMIGLLAVMLILIILYIICFLNYEEIEKILFSVYEWKRYAVHGRYLMETI